MDQPKGQWYRELVQNINSYAEQLGLDDPSTVSLRDFIMDVAREQYKIGNSSGIRWARQNPKPATPVA